MDKKIQLGILGMTAAAGAVAVGCSIYENRHLSVNHYIEHSSCVAAENSIRLAFISDLHGKTYGEGNIILLDTIKACNPDVIVIGGDMLVNRDPYLDGVSIDFLNKVRKTAPVYMAPGNHEKGVNSLKMFEKRSKFLKTTAEKLGINILENERVQLNDSICLAGLDPDYKYYSKVHAPKLTAQQIEEYIGAPEAGKYNIMLAHSPAFFSSVAENNWDLVLAGHYHGGAVRIPLIGGVISPQFRMFPKFSKGRFTKDNSVLIVSGGCGSHTVDLRVFNKPEVVVIDICS